MDRNKIRDFFNRLAPEWDANMVRNDEIINTILENVHVEEGCDVLDVACGTGVLIPDYLKRNVRSVTGIDLSEKMIEIARAKFEADDRVTLVCDDVTEHAFEHQFDSIIVYNALPHFEDPETLIRVLSGLLRKGGYLTIAHGASRDSINRHHSNVSSDLKKELPPIEELTEMMSRYLEVTVAISDERMYQAAGCKK